MSETKRVIIIAGPNGAGKTTLARTLLAPLKDSIRFINADYIAAGLSPFDPELVAIRAGKIMLEEVRNCFHRVKSGLALFHSHYKHIVNAWMLYDNSNDTMKLIDSGENQ